MKLAPADLDRLEQLARAAAPGPYGVETFAIADPKCGTVVLPGPRCLVEVGYDMRPPKPLPVGDARYFAALDPATVLALVEAARRTLRPPDPRELGSSQDFADLLDDFRASVAWDTVTDEADRLVAHEVLAGEEAMSTHVYRERRRLLASGG